MGSLLDRTFHHHDNEVSDLNAMENVQRGPEIELNLPEIEIGAWIYETLNSLPPDFTILTESDTGKTITAGSLLESSASLAVALNELKVEKNDHVAIIGDNTINLCIAGFGTLFVGAVMCPIDPTLKSLEFQHILNVIQPKLIISDLEVMSEVVDARNKLGIDAPIVIADGPAQDGFFSMEDMIQEISHEDFSPAEIDDIRTDLAVIVCSSGTTGMPKGVGISHFALLFQIRACNSNWPPGIFMHTSYFYWISGVLILIGTTISGIARVLVRKADPLMVLQGIQNHKPTMAMITPTLVTAILNLPEFHDFDVTSLNGVVVGGAPINQHFVEKFREMFPKTTLKQVYGCSELAGVVTQSDQSCDILSIGYLIPNVEIKIIDRATGAVLGPEEQGELLIRSPSIMKGYVRNEEATAEAIDQDGWYHTGDIGKYTQDKLFYITGRAKELMKVEGHQISPEEIEGVLSGLDGVLDAAVAGILVGENNLPMALVIKNPDSDITEEDIMLAVQEHLSEFKQLRAGVHFVDSIPRTSTGKVKRRVVQILAEELYFNSE